MKTETEISLAAKKLAVICIVSNLSYYPYFQTTIWARFLVIGIWLVWASSVFLQNSQSLFDNITIRRVTLFFTSFLLVNIAWIFFGSNFGGLKNHFILPVITAFVILLTSYSLGKKLATHELVYICHAYMYCTSLMTIPLFLFYVRGINIDTSYYAYTYGKNEIAVLLVCSINFLVLLFQPQKTWELFFQIAAIIFQIGTLILIRCRSAFVCMAVMLCYIVFNQKGIKRSSRFLLIAMIAIVGIYLGKNPLALDNLITKIFFAGRSSSTVDELSSGRITQICEGLQVFFDNPIFGVGYRRTLDCFFVSILANYGIMCYPLLFLALYPLYWGGYNFKHNREPICLCFIFIVLNMEIFAFFEELAPFGPGTRCYILWLMWGILLANQTSQFTSVNAKNNF